MTTPTILIVGATGNTGRSVVKTLSAQIAEVNSPPYRILALTRSTNSQSAKEFAKLSNVTIEEKNWIEITPDWLKERNVEKAFIASHNEPTQFADESAFHVAALHAGVKYVVRISTTACNVRPDFLCYYPRQHWAIEALLSSPEFEALQWTSLQPNIFHTYLLGPALEYIKAYRKDGQQKQLVLFSDADAPVGSIDADDVGRFAAALLAESDHSARNGKKYVLNGPEDITGKDQVKLVEQYIGTEVKDVKFNDLSFLDAWAASSEGSTKTHVLSIKQGFGPTWSGKASTSTTSKEFKDLVPNQLGAAEWLKSALEASDTAAEYGIARHTKA